MLLTIPFLGRKSANIVVFSNISFHFRYLKRLTYNGKGKGEVFVYSSGIYNYIGFYLNFIITYFLLNAVPMNNRPVTKVNGTDPFIETKVLKFLKSKL